MKNKFVANAIKRPGALTAAVGGKPSKNIAAVRALAGGSGGPQKQREASFYLNVLRKAGK